MVFPSKANLDRLAIRNARNQFLVTAPEGLLDRTKEYVRRACPTLEDPQFSEVVWKVIAQLSGIKGLR